VTDTYRSKAQQRDLTSRFAYAFDNAPIGMALLDVDLRARATGTFRDVNAALCRLTGRTRESLLHSGLEEILEPVDAKAIADAFEDLVLDRTRLIAIEARYVSGDDLRRWLLLHVSLIYEPTTLGVDAYAVVQVVDITDSKRAEHRLESLAYRDPLTELLNRRGIEARVGLYAEIASADPVSSALLLIDLDYFKYVNDTKGHSIGDRLLQSVASALERCVRQGDLVARLGGDEFIVILFDVDAATAFERSEALRAMISHEVERYSRSGLVVSASVGVALCHDGFASGLEDTLSAADAALSEAKESGRNRTHLSKSLVGDREEMRVRLDWAQRVRNALRTDGFQLFRQPILDLHTDIVDRYELLVRMIGHDDAFIDPANFLREADRFGMMVEVDAWVVNEAIRICANDQRAGKFVKYEVNLSGASLSHEGTAHAIESEILRQSVDPKRLVFEVTETTAISNMEKAFELATSLRSLGCEFALDDFGAGFSSFYYLKRLPFDYLKLDGEYVQNLADDPQDQHIVQSIVALARGLGKKTIAEFVTDERTADLLRAYGVDYAQGFYVGRAVAFESAAEPKS
jgi:diguanylate cyclase (GGDEF)-like protein/PAS domain S-box-containing protein